MSMSPLFALNCRRRSHSASSPSPSPVPVSSCRPAHKRAHSSHRDTPTHPDSQRCHLDIWRTGKRPRRDFSPSQATRSSTPASTDSTTSSSSSAPHTPLFPASSADFLLYPLCRGNATSHNPHSPSIVAPFVQDDTCTPSKSDLIRLRSEAFSELQRSVQENGEGFVRRMREFEDSRSKSVQHSRPGGIKRRHRKRHSPSVPSTRPTTKIAVSDDDDDVLIFSSALGSESIHQRQRRSSSLGAMDDSDLQLYDASDSSGRLSPITSIFHSIPFPRFASHVHPSTNSRSMERSTSFSTSFDFRNLSHTNAFEPTSSFPSFDSLASSADVFLSGSYTEDSTHPSSSFVVRPLQAPCHPPAGTEKAIAALTLAMANGAGSLGDYEAVRALHVSSSDESQVGELWH